MEFCFPGLDAHGSDLPPRRECADAWRAKLFQALPQLEIILLIGFHAQRWRLGNRGLCDMTANMRNWKAYVRVIAASVLAQ